VNVELRESGKYKGTGLIADFQISRESDWIPNLRFVPLQNTPQISPKSGTVCNVLYYKQLGRWCFPEVRGFTVAPSERALRSPRFISVNR
jgi:hypothetical protein